MIVAFSVGPILGIVVGLMLSAAQLSLFQTAPEQRWRIWAAGISADSIIYSAAVFVQYNTNNPFWLQQVEKLELTALGAIPILTFGLAGWLFRREMVRLVRLFSAISGILLAASWFLPFTLTGTISERVFEWLPVPYTEAMVGWYGFFLLIFAGIGGTTVVLLAFLSLRRSEPLYRTIVYAATVWLITGIHDIVVKFGLPGLPYVMNYGWLVFSFSLLAVMVKEQSQLRRAVDLAQRNTKEILEAAPSPTIVFNAGNAFVFSNPVVQTLFGANATDIAEIAAQIPEIGLRETFVELVRASFRDSSNRSDEFLFQDRNGNKRTMIADIRPLTPKGKTGQLRILTLTDISSIREKEKDIRYLAEYDHLTGLPNKRVFEQTVIALLNAEARRKHHDLHALFFLDLDSFKPVNDSLGHSVGDGLLREVANRISDRIRKSDTLYRFGGDEFVLLARNLRHAENAAEIAASIRELFQESFRVDATEVALGISIGIAVFPEDGNDYETLVRKADHAMYHAKQHQSGFQFFSEKRHGQAIQTMTLTRDLRSAVRRKQIELFYQPIVEQKSATVVGFEALCRWTHKRLGLISPERCIPIAENVGLIHDMTIDFIEQVFADLPEIDGACSGSPFVSVNVSPLSLHNSHFEECLERLVARERSDTSRIVLEITESFRLQVTDETLDRISRIRDMGFRLSLDDFGAGCASLEILEKLQLDFLKIDRSFLASERDQTQKHMIIEILLSLKDAYNIPSAVIEGVEERQQISSVPVSMPDILLQGYFYGKPLPLTGAIAAANRPE